VHNRVQALVTHQCYSSVTSVAQLPAVNRRRDRIETEMQEMSREGGRTARTVTGASTRCTLLSSMRISMALRHSALTSASVSGSHRFSCSICRSRSDAPISASAAAGPSLSLSLQEVSKKRRGSALFAGCFSKILGLGGGGSRGARADRGDVAWAVGEPSPVVRLEHLGRTASITRSTRLASSSRLRSF
jgi:hypothetical protein